LTFKVDGLPQLPQLPLLTVDVFWEQTAPVPRLPDWKLPLTVKLTGLLLRPVQGLVPVGLTVMAMSSVAE
jgi:hypothetical protein